MAMTKISDSANATRWRSVSGALSSLRHIVASKPAWSFLCVDAV